MGTTGRGGSCHRKQAFGIEKTKQHQSKWQRGKQRRVRSPFPKATAEPAMKPAELCRCPVALGGLPGVQGAAGLLKPGRQAGRCVAELPAFAGRATSTVRGWTSWGFKPGSSGMCSYAPMKWPLALYLA